MIDAVLSKIFGTKYEREVKKLRPLVAAINALEPSMEALSDNQLAAKTIEHKQKLVNGATLDDILVEAFEVCREGGRRALGMRHYDVQLIGGMVLHHGKIAEMKTGEGKTLVATLPVYLNSLAGEGVHVERWNEIYRQHKLVTDAERQDVVASGGLHIVGTERHEPRRIDSQLRGRAGRQGDLVRPASSSRCRMTCCASSAASAFRTSCSGWAWKRLASVAGACCPTCPAAASNANSSPSENQGH